MIAEGILPSACPQGHLAALPTDEPGVFVCGACGGGSFTDRDHLIEDSVCQGHPGRKLCPSTRAHLELELSVLRESWRVRRANA